MQGGKISMNEDRSDNHRVIKKEVGGSLGLVGVLEVLHQAKASGVAITIFIGLLTLLYAILGIVIMIIFLILPDNVLHVKIILAILILLVPLFVWLTWARFWKLSFIRFIQRLDKMFTYQSKSTSK
jgi:cytochrome c biogenesis protein CcdA